MRTLLAACIALLLCLDASAQSTPTIDGLVDASEWADARVVDAFVLIEPRTRQPLPYPTRAYIKATADGLAIAFECAQPASIARRREQSARDQSGPVDRVSVIVDYEGAGRSGLAFTVTLSGSVLDGTVVNENQYSTDWNGRWQHAVSENAEGWSAEMLLPWHLAPMPPPVDGQRQLGIALSRVIGTTGERVAWPAVHLSEPRFLSVLAPLEVAAYQQTLLAFTPYGVGLYDIAHQRQDFDAGLDVFWKPNNAFQLSGTLNPDFGQVESDQLVVNFGAVETFFSDRRPFFTENQSLFDVPFGISNSRLIYTRRVGGPADDGDGSSDVEAAIKLNGSVGRWQYGLFAAEEGDAAGRSFLAARGVADFGENDLGFTLTDVERQFLDRQARTGAIDHRWTRGENLSLTSTVVGSQIDDGGASDSALGFQSRLEQRFSDRYSQQIYALHMDDGLDLNDFGYLDRDDLDYLRYQFGNRRTEFEEGSRLTSVDNSFATSTRHTTDGMLLFNALAWYRYATFNDGGTEYSEITWLSDANDDLILRGNGVVRLPQKFIAYYERYRPRKGDWALGFSAGARNEGLEGMDRPSVDMTLFPTYFFSDTLSVSPTVSVRYAPDWLLWRGNSRLASFEARQLNVNADFNWILSPKSELRIKLETIALRARARQSYVVGADREPVPVADLDRDFSLSNLGFQVRFRYELAPLSDLYIVYSRGGLAFDQRLDDVGSLFNDALMLDDDEQFLVKVSYRLEV
jgi:hypothetical protein